MAKLSFSFEVGAMCIAGRGLEGDGEGGRGGRNGGSRQVILLSGGCCPSNYQPATAL